MTIPERSTQLLSEKPEALIFDMDGTLFKTETVIVAAYERAYARLKGEGRVQGEQPPTSILLGSLGMLLADIWARVLPEADIPTRERMDVLLLEEQLALLAEGILVRDIGIPGCLRVTAGTEAETTAFLDALERLDAARA